MVASVTLHCLKFNERFMATCGHKKKNLYQKKKDFMLACTCAQEFCEMGERYIFILHAVVYAAK